MNKSSLDNSQNLKDRYYTRNVFGISSVEFTWGLGLPVVIESTFLQLFIKSLGASSLVIGLIPTFFFIGSSIFALFSSYFTSRLEFKRTAVVLLHLFSGLSLLFFGVFLYLFSTVDYLLVVFFISYGIFSLSLGMTLPVWLNYLVDILSDEKSVSGIAFMLIAQNCAKFVGSMVIVKIVDKYSFSVESSSLVFIAVGALFSIGSLFFMITKEVPAAVPEKNDSRQTFLVHTLESFRHLIKNRNFLLFLAGDFEFYIIVTVISFYANYATTFCGINPAIASGVFVACIYSGAICANFLLGSLGWLDLKKKYIFSKCVSFSAILLLITFQDQWAFFVTSFLLGLSRGTRMVSMAPATKRLSGLADSTSYFAIAPLVTLPIASGMPIVAGLFLDRFSHLGGDSYRIVFGSCAFLIVITLFFILKTDFSGNHRVDSTFNQI
ncbi:MFS transporter [bacterium]|nr:MFS transporter [bacterium]